MSGFCDVAGRLDLRVEHCVRRWMHFGVARGLTALYEDLELSRNPLEARLNEVNARNSAVQDMITKAQGARDAV